MIKFITTIFLLTFYFALKAQSTSSKVFIGVEAGPSIVAIHGIKLIEFRPRLAYTLGMNMQFKLCDRIDLKTGISYQEKGGNNKVYPADEFGNFAGEYIDRIYHNFLVVPAIACVNFGSEDVFFSLNGGLFMGLRFSSKTESDNPYHFESQTEYKPYEFGFIIYPGFNFELGDKYIFGLDLKTNIGFTDLFKHSYGNDSKLKTFSFAPTVNLKYKL
ncbi:MAG: PorT family protein [Bacteroidales bacterium]|nr:PorT family protein [Bacteroidales bacterium]